MNNKLFGSFAIVGAAALWSVDGLLRRGLYHLPPTVIVFWEHLFGLVVLLCLTLPSWRAFGQLNRRQWWSIILVSFLSGALGTILYTAALGQVHYISYSVVVLLQQLQPLFAIIASAILLHEPIKKSYLGLAAVALICAYAVSFPTLQVNFATGTGTAIAALLAIGAAVCWGASTAFSKFSLQNTSVLHVTTLRFFFTVIFAFLLSLPLGQTSAITNLTTHDAITILAITFSTGMAALALYYFGLKRILASRATLLELTWPLSAAIIGMIFLHDSLSLTQYLGAIILLVTIRAVVIER